MAKPSAVPHQPIPLRLKLIYGSGDMLGGGALAIVNFYFAIYLTDVVGLSPAYAGVVFFAGQAWNAVWAPFMGRLSDRTRTRFGRRKPFFMAGSPLLLVATVVLWTAFPLPGQLWRLVYATAAYVFYITIVVMVMVPYLALLPEITPDYRERTSVNGVRFGFSGVAMLAAALIPMNIVARFDDPRAGYLVMAVVFGLVFSAPWIVIALTVKERAPPEDSAPGTDWVRELLRPLRIRTFRHVVIMYLVATLARDVQSTIMAYYVTYHLGRPAELSTILGTIVVTNLCFLAVHMRIAHRIGKHRAYALAGSLQIVTALSMAFLPAAAPSWAIYAIAVLGGIGGGQTMLVWTMFPDAADVVELASGRRVEGSLGGLMAMLRKTASASTIFLVLQVLAIAGYVSAAEAGIRGVSETFAQPAPVVTTIRAFIGGVPLVLLTAGVIVAFRYRLDADHHSRLRAVLETGLGRESGHTAREAARLRRHLV